MARNKIQDRYKPDIYVVVGHHQEPNMYYIQLLNSDSKGHPKVVNCCQIYDLNRSCPPLESLGSGSEGANVPVSPCFLTGRSLKSNISNFSEPIVQHHYNTMSKPKGSYQCYSRWQWKLKLHTCKSDTYQVSTFM